VKTCEKATSADGYNTSKQPIRSNSMVKMASKGLEQTYQQLDTTNVSIEADVVEAPVIKANISSQREHIVKTL
jgi:hypothetical protein